MSEPIFTTIINEEGSETLTVSELGNNLYRLEEPGIVFENLSIFDVFEGQKVNKGIRLVRIVEKSAWRTMQYVISKDVLDSGQLKPAIERIAMEGGGSQRAFGGLLIVWLPPSSTYDPDSDLGIQPGHT